MIELGHLVEHLRAGNLVAFLGAGASRSYSDPLSGKTWAGLPTAAGLVERLAMKRSYIDKNMAFDEACFLLKHHDGRSDLEAFLVENMDRPAIQPLPADIILANLPFSAYITTNFDTLLEKALIQEKKRPHVVITDADVSRLRTHNTPLLKIHGCITRPDTLIASSEEYVPLSRRLPVVEALLKTYLANRVIIFLGFALEDDDFGKVFEETRQALGSYMPKSYAVVQDVSDFKKQFWNANGVQIIKADLTDFLRELLKASTSGATQSIYHPGEDWINNAFFESLHRIRTLPSETQVIDAFLEHLREEMQAPSFHLDDVVARAMKAMTLVMEQRPNHHALEKLGTTLLDQIRTSAKTKDEAESIITRLINEREAIGHRFSSKGRELISRGESVLLYSQSIRVLQLLLGVPKGIQDTCQIYVSECRPKSPGPFQDALSTCENLERGGYEITIIPDVAIGNLMSRRQINKVIMGAHQIFLRDGKPVAFVNTCGSMLVSQAARDYKVPMYVVAESGKIEHILTNEELPAVSFKEEEAIFPSIETTVSNLKASGLRIGTLNIGYDLCVFPENGTLVTD